MKTKIIIGMLILMIFVSGCNKLPEGCIEGRMYVWKPWAQECIKTIEEHIAETDVEDDGCTALSGFELKRFSYFPTNITLDDNIVLTFESVDKFNIFDLSNKIRQITDGAVGIFIFDDYGIPINYWSKKEYMRCDLETINALQESNLSNLIDDICTREPEVSEIKVIARFPDDEHKLEVCE